MRRRYLAIAVLLLALLSVPVIALRQSDPPAAAAPVANAPALAAAAIVRSSPPVGAVQARVAGHVDGDTISVTAGGRTYTLRLVGVDTPETRHPSVGVECFGPQASAFTRTLIPVGTTVWLTRDVSDTDRYGRLLRFVWRQSATSSYTMVNEELVRNGYAVVSTYPPDVAMVDTFLAAERAARADNIGLWPACGGADTPATPLSPSATRTPTLTRTPSATRTPTLTRTPSATRTPTLTRTPSATRTPTLTRTPSATRTPSLTATATRTPATVAAATSTPSAVATGELTVTAAASVIATATAVCDPAYPTICLPPPPPDLNCSDITERSFTVLAPDPHKFDRDGNGVGCES